MIFLSYLGSHWSLVLAVAVIVAALAGLAWVMKSLKYIVAAAAVLALGFMYQAVDMEGYKRRVAEDATKQVKILQSHIDTLDAITSTYNDRYKSDQQELSKLKELARETPANSSTAFPADAARRLRAIR
jgi:hypothetical protein